MPSTYWQIEAGSFGRDYSSFFLRYGIAFLGGEEQAQLLNEVQEGDVLVLKKGLCKIVAAGKVVRRGNEFKGNGDKEWLQDLDGWELPSYCYVNWHVPESPITTDGLHRATIRRLPQDKHKAIADSLLTLPALVSDPEPEATLKISDNDILEYLITEGLRPSAADELTRTIRRIRLLAGYYYKHCNWTEIREHETRTFLVVPLLLALGWSEQQLKIEFHSKGSKIDIACFDRPFTRKSSKCTMIIETKGFSLGLDYAPEQARAYAQELPDCATIVVTNGYCYKPFTRQSGGGYGSIPDAYLNMLTPRDRYPLDPMNVGGALKAIRTLLPIFIKEY